jgi:hypothetical protein
MRLAEQMTRHHEMFVDSLRMAEPCQIKAFASDTKTMALEVIDLDIDKSKKILVCGQDITERPTLCVLALISVRTQ